MTRKTRELVRWMFYLYLFLWVFEGAFRKWIIPSMANPLLIIRDPVVMMIYLTAFVGGLWPKTLFLPLLLLLAGLFTVGAFLAETFSMIVSLYGLRSNFLHLPVIFLVPIAFNAVDVRRIGRWLLILSVPMVLLMTMQFKAPPEAFVNAGAGKGAAQLDSAMGRVRASGTWSFVVGTVCFYSIVAAYLFYGQTTKRSMGWILSIMAAGSLVLAGTVAGSRSLIAGAAASFLFFIIGIALHPPSMLKAGRIVALGAVSWLGISAMDIFKESQEVMQARIENAKSSGSMAERVLSFFEFGLGQTSMFGKGLGKGTNVGAALLGKKGDFLLAEDEWKRITQESGFLFGPLFIFYRIALFAYLMIHSLKAARKGNMLPICLLGSCGLNVLTGQFGVPTVQGFTCFTAGMVLAACDPLVAAEVKFKELKLLALNGPSGNGGGTGPEAGKQRRNPQTNRMLPAPKGFKPVRPGLNPASPTEPRLIPSNEPKRLEYVNPHIVHPVKNPKSLPETSGGKTGKQNPFIVRPTKPQEPSSDDSHPRT